MPITVTSTLRANTDQVTRGQDSDVCSRIRAEFSEMPGLKLTPRQAARLFNLEAERCERVLGALVEAGTLALTGGAFVRADSGRRHA